MTEREALQELVNAYYQSVEPFSTPDQDVFDESRMDLALAAARAALAHPIEGAALPERRLLNELAQAWFQRNYGTMMRSQQIEIYSAAIAGFEDGYRAGLRGPVEGAQPVVPPREPTPSMEVAALEACDKAAGGPEDTDVYALFRVVWRAMHDAYTATGQTGGAKE